MTDGELKKTVGIIIDGYIDSPLDLPDIKPYTFKVIDEAKQDFPFKFDKEQEAFVLKTDPDLYIGPEHEHLLVTWFKKWFGE